MSAQTKKGLDNNDFNLKFHLKLPERCFKLCLCKFLVCKVEPFFFNLPFSIWSIYQNFMYFYFVIFFYYYLFNSLVYFSSPVFATDFSFKLPVFLQNEIAQIYFSMVLGSLFPHYCIYCKQEENAFLLQAMCKVSLFAF